MNAHSTAIVRPTRAQMRLRGAPVHVTSTGPYAEILSALRQLPKGDRAPAIAEALAALEGPDAHDSAQSVERILAKAAGRA